MAEVYPILCSSAAVPLLKKDGDDLVNEGRALIPSKWVDVDKNSHKVHDLSFAPKVESRELSILRELRGSK